MAEVLTDGDGYETVRFEPHEADENYIRPLVMTFSEDS